MRSFVKFFNQADSSASTKLKVTALSEYFASAHKEDASWALYFLLGNRLSKIISTSELKLLTGQASQIPAWLILESYHQVGDLAETIALLLKPYYQTNSVLDLGLKDLVENRLIAIKDLDILERSNKILELWRNCDFSSCLLINKLLTGGLRLGISAQLVIRSLAQLANLPESTIASRLRGKWDPTPESFTKLLDPLSEGEESAVRPSAFLLANPVDGDVSVLGEAKDFQAEWKWDGIRGQLVISPESTLLWSRGDEDISNSFPELIQHASLTLPLNTAIDGEVLAWKDDTPLPFSSLQKRINKKQVSKKLQQEIPVKFVAYDLLFLEGQDLREKALKDRRKLLNELILADSTIGLSAEIDFQNWQELIEIRSAARSKLCEGLMLKNKNSQYLSGRKRGAWWKWKLEPFVVDAVLTYAQRGHGRRSGLYTDFTFGVWQAGELITVAKAYSGLSDIEFYEVNKFINSNTLDKFGPVRTVKPQLVFEIAFEGIASSARHKAGLALRFPRIKRWRKDKPASEAGTLNDLQELLASSLNTEPE